MANKGAVRKSGKGIGILGAAKIRGLRKSEDIVEKHVNENVAVIPPKGRN